MGGVALLPQELRRPEEHAGAHLPPHHVRPLVAQYGQVAVALDPVLVRAPDDGLARRTHDELLLQLRTRVHHHAAAVRRVHQPVVRHHGALLRKTLHVLGLAAQEALRDKQREISVLVTRSLEHRVQLALHLLPDGIAVGLYHHATPHRTLLGQIGPHHQLVIPLRVVLTPFRKIFCHNSLFSFFCCLYAINVYHLRF